MKKSIKCILLSSLCVPVLAGAMFSFTGCGKNETLKGVSASSQEMIAKIEESEAFTGEKTLTIKSIVYGENKISSILSVIPDYNNGSNHQLNDKLNNQNQISNGDYAKLRLVFDATWAYSYRIIKDNTELMVNAGDVKLTASAQSAVNALATKIDAFDEKIKDQEQSLQTFRDYMYDIGTSRWEDGIAKNAVYNYLKDYQVFVREGINLAKATNDVVDHLYKDEQAKEVNLTSAQAVPENRKIISHKLGLEIFDIYYNFIIEKTGIIGDDYYSAFGGFCYDVYRDYLLFSWKLFNGVCDQNNYLNKISEYEFKSLMEQRDVFVAEAKKVQEIINRLDTNSIILDREGDYLEGSIKEKIEISYLRIYFEDILKGWIENFTTILFD